LSSYSRYFTQAGPPHFNHLVIHLTVMRGSFFAKPTTSSCWMILDHQVIKHLTPKFGCAVCRMQCIDVVARREGGLSL